MIEYSYTLINLPRPFFSKCKIIILQYLGEKIKRVNKNIFILLFITCLFSITSVGNTLHKNGKDKSLRQKLEEFRKTNGINLIYSDELVEDLAVQESQFEILSQNQLASFLDRYDISYKEFGENTFVLFKKKKMKTEAAYDKVITEEVPTETDSHQLILKPMLISNPQPSYPHQAVKNKIEGSVRVKFLVGEDGSVNESKVLATSGYAILDSAAKEFVYNLKYSPAVKDGKPYSSWMSIIFRYVLGEKDNKQIPQVSY